MGARHAFPVIAAALFMAACTSAATSLQPIQGSITYNGQPRTKLTKSPVGSTFTHMFRGPNGDLYEETYRILPDRSLQIAARRNLSSFIGLRNGRDP